MKKLSVLLVAVLIVSMLPAAALAQEAPSDTDGPGERIIEQLKDRAEQAIEKRLDCFVTGEGAHWNHHLALEAGIDVIYARSADEAFLLASQEARRIHAHWLSWVSYSC